MTVAFWLHFCFIKPPLELILGINISIKNVPKKRLDLLKQRAKRNHRSLQGELMALIEQATTPPAARTFSVTDLLDRGQRMGLRTPDEAADWIRELRDSR